MTDKLLEQIWDFYFHREYDDDGFIGWVDDEGNWVTNPDSVPPEIQKMLLKLIHRIGVSGVEV